MVAPQSANARALAAFVVISLAVVGFFTGLQSPMKAPVTEPPLKVVESDVSAEELGHGGSQGRRDVEAGVIPATHYSSMPDAIDKLRNRSSLVGLKSMVVPQGEITVEPAAKKSALHQRGQNRAYNGAPPTIPHPINQISDASCIACHGVGFKSDSLRISQMSHQFLTNCTQCHIENEPQHLRPVIFRENNFDGVDPPQEGPRAFPEAPPQIPHATWMRTDCLSCHGYAGLHGIRTTHPWRSNCQQCHASNAAMDQTFPVDRPRFLPGPATQESPD